MTVFHFLMKTCLPLCLVILFPACASLSKHELSGRGAAQWSGLSASHIKSHLKVQQAAWRNVRYRLGGVSKSGIDCSGFVMVTYRDKFGINLPRSTKGQVLVGRAVRKRDLQVGDLVFFKTALFTRHVGIYMGRRRFLHASASRGVMVSSLDNPYWKSAYWTSRQL